MHDPCTVSTYETLRDRTFIFVRAEDSFGPDLEESYVKHPV